ncbi:hypothetical protein [Telmatospirillum sp.]|uniref:hypothetical protein n=1 Tax=Telmatospirillum sp. TaxID=2079197 RepID=UPI0028444BD4|nr:hypothetical protein [Telmatospirillum sp.]MDR3434992.1 hypothetical protein [Telmatospirillum sp.]
MTEQDKNMTSHLSLRSKIARHAKSAKTHIRKRMFIYCYVTTILIFLIILPYVIKVDSFISAALRSEYLELQIPKSSPFAIVLPAAAVPGAAACNDTITIRVPPGSGARVYYQRIIGDDLNIRITGRYGWSYNGGPLQPVDGTTKFVLGRNGKRNDCQSPEHIRLPIYGRMIVGLESGGPDQAPSLPILSGQIHIFTKIIDKIWIFGNRIPFRVLPFMSSGLYEADTITIGAGSQLYDTNVDQDDGKSSAIWHGFVDIDFSNINNTERGMLIEAASTANGVKLVSPVEDVKGSVSLSDQSDVVSLSTLETLIKDPNIHVILIFLGIPLGVAEVLDKIKKAFSSEQKSDSRNHVRGERGKK